MSGPKKRKPDELGSNSAGQSGDTQQTSESDRAA
jgi:hypothetical protein